MFVCLCNAITDRALREAAQDGPLSVEAAYARLGAELQCGRCADEAAEILGKPRAACDRRPAHSTPEAPPAPFLSAAE